MFKLDGTFKMDDMTYSDFFEYDPVSAEYNYGYDENDNDQNQDQ